MKILAVESSTKYLCIGVYDNGKIYEYNLEVGRKLSGLITISIERVLNASGISLSSIDYFACGLGPGSFTGIRTALATIKAMAFVTSKPIVGVSSLEILAEGVEEAGNISVVLDAKRDLFYYGDFRKIHGILKKAKPYMLLDKTRLCREIKPKSSVVGDGIVLCRDALSSCVKNIQFIDKDYWYPQAQHMIKIALTKIKNNNLTNAFKAKPIYLYPKECQVRR